MRYLHGRSHTMSRSDPAREREEAALLLGILRRRLDEVAAQLSGREPLGPSFVALAQNCDVDGQLLERLARAERLDWLQPEALATLEATRQRRRRDNLLLLAVAGQALELLAGAGITPIALKGFDLVHRGWYPFDARGFDDVDLLLAEDELPPALAAFAEAGWQVPAAAQTAHYARSSHHLPIASPGSAPVHFELHWNLAQEGRYTIDVPAMIERVQPMSADGRSLLRLDDHDVVAHLLLHHFTHYFDRRLKWLVDLDALVGQPGFDWDLVVERVRAWGATAAVGSSLVHIARLWPELAPESVRSRLPFAAWRRALCAPLASTHPLELFRGTRQRAVQLYLAAVLLERPWDLPGWLLHRRRRDRVAGDHPLDPGSAGGDQVR